MKRFMLVFAALLVLAAACTSAPTSTPVPPTTVPTSIPPTATLVPPTATPQGAKQVKLIYLENGKPVSARELWLSFYDENNGAWITKKEITDKDAIAAFPIPGGKSGESFCFTFAFSESEINKFIGEIKGGQRRGFRIPPDPTQTSVGLRLDVRDNSKADAANNSLQVADGTIQICAPK